MGVIKFESEDGVRQISSILDYDEQMSAWVIDVSGGGVDNIGANVEELVIPEHRVYEVQLTADELDDRAKSGTF